MVLDPAAGTPPGTRTATLNVPTGTPPTVTLTGTATQAGISLPSSFTFAPQLAGTSGTAQPVTVTNSGSGAFAGALTVTSIAKGGTNPGDFAVTADACTGGNTPPGANCSIQVSFRPTQAATCGPGTGARSATLILSDNATGSPHSVQLSGSAMDFCIDAAPGQAVSGPISAGQQATYMLEINSSMGFSGVVGLAVAGAPPLGTSSLTTAPPTAPASVQVAPSAPGQFSVVVMTAARGALTADRRQRNKSDWSGGSRTWWLAIILTTVLVSLTMRKTGTRTRAEGRALGVVTAVECCGLVLALALGLAACGSGGAGGAAAVIDPPPGTPAGTYMRDRDRDGRKRY